MSPTKRKPVRAAKKAAPKRKSKATKKPAAKKSTKPAAKKAGRVPRKKAAASQSSKSATALMWNPRVACRTLDETAFILLNSRMVRLNEVGTRIWELFEKGATLPVVVNGIVQEFETTKKQATLDAQAFVEELITKEMLVPLAATSQKSGRTS